jgi:copper oxidase (laccase) domain-containing protein
VTETRAIEFFPALTAIPGVIHGFTQRIPGVDVRVDRELALQRLEEVHAELRAEIGLGNRRCITGEQLHGATVAVVNASTDAPVPLVDGLITTDPVVCLAVYVADCGPVYLVDPVKRVIALLHSGRKGTEQGITTVAIERMIAEFGCAAKDIVMQLGPCIRPPLYEIDFAAEILRQARGAGVRQVHDCGVCTGENVDRYYSYRVEKGRTGRMVAILALA